MNGTTQPEDALDVLASKQIGGDRNHAVILTSSEFTSVLLLINDLQQRNKALEKENTSLSLFGRGGRQ